MEDFNFTVDIQIRMSDLDPFNHVNNGAQCHLFDYGRSSYIEHLTKKSIDWGAVDLVLVHIELDFFAPVQMHEAIVCDTKIYEIGNKSMKMIQQLRDKNSNQVKTICRSVLSGIDRNTGTSIPISEEYRRLIGAFEG